MALRLACRGIVFTNNDDAYLTALTLKRAGVGVAAIVDSRPACEGALAEEARHAGIDDPLTAHAIAGVEIELRRAVDHRRQDRALPARARAAW